MPGTLILPITTRGIGMNLCSFYADVVNLLPNTELPKIYASYRALLALVESRFLNIGPVYSSVEIYSYKSLLRPYYDLMNIPVIFKRLLEAINILQYKNINYIPAMSKNTYKDGKFIPRPENIILSNLKETVDALKASDVDDDEEEDPTFLQYRKKFYKNNPIPGAIWNENNYKLMNADDIISSKYDLENDVFNDMHSLLSLSIQLKEYSNYINKDCTKRRAAPKIFSMFVCNEMGDLRVPDRGHKETLRDYYCHSRPTNNTDSFYSRFRLTNNRAMKEGALFLLGEYPNDESVVQPIYEVRSEHNNSYFYYDLSYHNSYLSYHSDILARSLQKA